MYYYKDHSADWWRKNGTVGFATCWIISAGAALILFRPSFESYANVVNKSELMIVYTFIAFGMVVGQMIMQRMSRNFLRYALYAKQGEFEADRGELAKYDAIMFWSWTADFAFFIVVYGLALANEFIFLVCALPIVGMLFIIMLVKASLATTHAKRMKRNNEKNERKCQKEDV